MRLILYTLNMDVKEEIKQRLSVEEVVGDYLELKRSGRNLKALSPFTNEKTPSFMVSPEKQIWHDFSSNQGGDIFTFVMLVEGVDFKGALELLARKANVDLSQYRMDGGLASKKKKLYELLELATRYYQHCLIKNSHALKYVAKQREYKKSTVVDFRLGYAPYTDNGLTTFLLKKGFKADELRMAGISVMRRSGLSDMFHGRIMIPLADGQGRTIGFTARILPGEESNQAPKYINTPQTILYDKSRHVFGLHLAKEAIRKQDEAIIVEGNLDVIASHQAGVNNVVATAGTALTPGHLKQVNLLTQNISLAFDSDDAGVAATERAIVSAQAAGVNLKIIDIDDGKDPDEIIRQDPELWEKAIASARHVMPWLFEHYRKKFDLKSGPGKVSYTNKLLDVISQIEDPVEQDHYINELAQIVDSTKKAIIQKLETKKSKPVRKKVIINSAKLEPDKSAYKDAYLALNLAFSGLRDSLSDIEEEMFEKPWRRQVFSYIIKHNQPVNNTPKELQVVDDYVKILLLKAQELYGDWTDPDRLVEAVGLKHRLIRENKQKLKIEIRNKLSEAEAKGDNLRVSELLKKYRELLREDA